MAGPKESSVAKRFGFSVIFGQEWYGTKTCGFTKLLVIKVTHCYLLIVDLVVGGYVDQTVVVLRFVQLQNHSLVIFVIICTYVVLWLIVLC